MSRTYKTLSLSLPPGVAEELAMIGKRTDRTAARVAAEIVLREIATLPGKKKEETRRKSWCCSARVETIQGQLVMPEDDDGCRLWVPATALLCGACQKQMHGREYEGWIADA